MALNCHNFVLRLRFAKIAVKLFVQKSKIKLFWLKIMPLPGKFPGDAHAAADCSFAFAWLSRLTCRIQPRDLFMIRTRFFSHRFKRVYMTQLMALYI